MTGAIPRISGVGRVSDNDRAIMLYFDRKLTDNEMRKLHDMLRLAMVRVAFEATK